MSCGRVELLPILLTKESIYTHYLSNKKKTTVNYIHGYFTNVSSTLIIQHICFPTIRMLYFLQIPRQCDSGQLQILIIPSYQLIFLPSCKNHIFPNSTSLNKLINAEGINILQHKLVKLFISSFILKLALYLSFHTVEKGFMRLCYRHIYKV